MNALVRLSLAVFSLAAALAVQAQDRLFASVDYMHVPEFGSEENYIALERLWMRIHQQAVDEGRCEGWHLFRVENGGRNQFVTVRLYRSVAALVDPWGGDLSKLIKALYSAEDAAKMDKTDDARLLTRSELWELEASAMKDRGDGGKYIVVSFMKAVPGKLDTYYRTEREVFRKGHQALVDAGRMEFWLFASRWFPSGFDAEYDFITINGHASKEASDKAWDMETITTRLTREEMARGEAIFETRKAVRSEIWRPVLRTQPTRR